jgi:hypothetical protein
VKRRPEEEKKMRKRSRPARDREEGFNHEMKRKEMEEKGLVWMLARRKKEKLNREKKGTGKKK